MYRVRAVVILGMVIMGLGLLDSSESRAQKPGSKQQENFARLLLRQQSQSLRSESRMTDRQIRSLQRLYQIEQSLPRSPQQQRVRQQIIRQTQKEIQSLQAQLRQTHSKFLLRQAALDQSLSSLGPLVATNPGLAQMVSRVQRQAASLEQVIQTLINPLPSQGSGEQTGSGQNSGNRPPATPYFPG